MSIHEENSKYTTTTNKHYELYTTEKREKDNSITIWWQTIHIKEWYINTYAHGHLKILNLRIKILESFLVIYLDLILLVSTNEKTSWGKWMLKQFEKWYIL